MDEDTTPYRRFAEIYDKVMKPVGYEMWADYVEQLCEVYGRRPQRVLDLACGTGSTSMPFARRGYEVVGLDVSPDMLAIARQRTAEAGLVIPYVQGDMRSFALGDVEPFDLAICLYDSINYLLDPGDIDRACAAVRRALVPDGLFIFDVNTRYRLSQVDDELMAFEDADYCLIWRNSYDISKEIWTANLTGFIRQGELFARFHEVHQERSFEAADLAAAVQGAGLELLAMFSAFGFEAVTRETSRIYVVAKRPERD